MRWIILCLLFFNPHPPTAGAAERVNRYTLVNTTPADLTDPLDVVIDLQYPHEIETIGQAVRYLLRDSGYTLVRGDYAPSSQQILMQSPLPGALRSTGRVTLSHALTALGYPSHRIVIDPVHRRIGYAVRAEFMEFVR